MHSHFAHVFWTTSYQRALQLTHWPKLRRDKGYRQPEWVSPNARRYQTLKSLNPDLKAGPRAPVAPDFPAAAAGQVWKDWAQSTAALGGAGDLIGRWVRLGLDDPAHLGSLHESELYVRQTRTVREPGC